MKTDKNSLFRAIGDIDDRYVAEILQETDRQQVFADIYDWAKARL